MLMTLDGVISGLIFDDPPQRVGHVIQLDSDSDSDIDSDSAINFSDYINDEHRPTLTAKQEAEILLLKHKTTENVRQQKNIIITENNKK